LKYSPFTFRSATRYKEYSHALYDLKQMIRWWTS